jgi:phenylpropionate dioxygenase-like ring-hydroxylating dioxygenase large terminal subunit
MHDSLRRYWYPVARAADIRDKPVAVKVLDEQVVLFRTGDRLTALKDLCIHRGAPLSLGWVNGDRITCAYHGWEYGTDGSCLRIPTLPDGKTIPRKAKAQRYLVEQRYGLAWVCLDDEPALPVPPYPAYDDTSCATVLYDEFRWKANAARVCENVLDFTHLPWVHDGMLGSRDRPIYPHVEPQVHPDGISYDVPDEANDTVRHYRVYAPFTAAIDVRSNRPDGHNYSMLFTCSPISTRETSQWFFTSRDWDLHRPDHDWEVFDAVVMEQDRNIVENQRPEELPLDLSEELHLRGSDAGTLAYRRFLRDLGVAWHH